MGLYEHEELTTNKIRITYNGIASSRIIDIEVGGTYWVQPDNPLKLKHRGRNCVVTNFYRDDLGNAIDASVRFLDDNSRGRVNLTDLVIDEPPHTIRPAYEKFDGIEQFAPEQVPDHLFTKNELKWMGLIPTEEPAASVYYTDQKRAFPLFNLHATRPQRPQKGFSLTITDLTVEEVLQRRKRSVG